MTLRGPSGYLLAGYTLSSTAAACAEILAEDAGAKALDADGLSLAEEADAGALHCTDNVCPANVAAAAGAAGSGADCDGKTAAALDVDADADAGDCAEAAKRPRCA